MARAPRQGFQTSNDEQGIKHGNVRQAPDMGPALAPVQSGGEFSISEGGPNDGDQGSAPKSGPIELGTGADTRKNYQAPRKAPPGPML